MKIRYILAGYLLSMSALLPLQAQEKDCDIHFMAILPQDTSISETVSEQLFNRLCNAISDADV